MGFFRGHRILPGDDRPQDRAEHRNRQRAARPGEPGAAEHDDAQEKEEAAFIDQRARGAVREKDDDDRDKRDEMACRMSDGGKRIRSCRSRHDSLRPWIDSSAGGELAFTDSAADAASRSATGASPGPSTRSMSPYSFAFQASR